jgi:hypothetical protein
MYNSNGGRRIMVMEIGIKRCKIEGCNTRLSSNAKVTRCARCCRLNIVKSIDETYRSW